MLAVSLIFSCVLGVIGYSLPEDGIKPDWYLYCSYLLPQLAFAVAVVLFFCFTQAEPKETYKGTHWKYYILAIVLQFGLFSLSWLNNWFLQFLHESIGYTVSETQIPSTEGWNLLLVIIVIAVLPAIFEESVFRGLMLGPMKRFSTISAVLLSGFLFALYHQNPAQTLYQFCCGCAFALVAVRANSVLPTVLSHFLNNAFIIILSAFKMNDFSGMGGTIFYICAAVALVAVLVYLIFFDTKSNTKKTESVKPFFLSSAVGIAVCGVMWLANLLQGVLS